MIDSQLKINKSDKPLLTNFTTEVLSALWACSEHRTASARAAVHLDLTCVTVCCQHLNSGQAARRATRWRTCKFSPRRPRGGGEFNQPGPMRQSSKWIRLSTNLRTGRINCQSAPASEERDGWRVRAGRSVNRTRAAFTRNRKSPDFFRERVSIPLIKIYTKVKH